jgi:hypothetical protein
MWLSQWVGLRRESRELEKQWPISPSRQAYAAQWLATVNEPGPSGWSPMSCMRESGQTPAEFAAQVASDPAESLYEPLRRHRAPKAPDDLPDSEQRSGTTVQNDFAVIFREPDCARPMADSLASDGVAIRMTAGPDGARGAMEIHGALLPRSLRSGRYKLYHVARIETADGARPDAPAFSARVFDSLSSRYIAERKVTIADTKPGYASYLVGTIDLNPYVRLWLGHAHDKAVKAVWFDRAFLVRAD